MGNKKRERVTIGEGISLEIGCKNKESRVIQDRLVQETVRNLLQRREVKKDGSRGDTILEIIAEKTIKEMIDNPKASNLKILADIMGESKQGAQEKKVEINLTDRMLQEGAMKKDK